MWPPQRLRNLLHHRPLTPWNCKEKPMGGLIYLVGLVVIVLFILSLLGLR
jgi:hypothetical protein